MYMDFWVTETNAGNMSMQSIVGTINFSSIKMQHYKGVMWLLLQQLSEGETTRIIKRNKHRKVIDT